MFEKIVEGLKKLTVITDLFAAMWAKGKDLLASLPASFRDYLKKTWMLWAVIGSTVLVYGGNLSQFKMILVILAPIALILLVVERILDAKEGWGLFPDFDFTAAFKQATSTPLSAALVILGFFAVLVTILICAAMVLVP